MTTQQKTVVLTGGGTVGHVTLNQLLIPEFKKIGFTPAYIGSKKGIEKDIISKLDIDYYSISSGKLRRYISLENILDLFRVGKGILDALIRLRKLKPLFVFSKGGFVSVPVVVAARLLNIPVYIHESDLTPGLANKIASKFASHVYVTFRKTLQYLPDKKSTYIGPVIRQEFSLKPSDAGFQYTGFNQNKPVMLIMGGSLGAKAINDFIRSNLERITDSYQIIHLCGYGNLDGSIDNANYRQYEFVTDELRDFMSMADIVVGRSGSNAIFEFLLSRKPMILIPLPMSQSRGDQIENARYFEQQKVASVILEEELNIDTFNRAIAHITSNRSEIVKKMKQFQGGFRPAELVQQLTTMRGE